MKIKELIFKIESFDSDQALEYVVKNAQKKGNKTFIVTINPELIMLAKKDLEYEKILKSADLALCDGVGILWAGKIFGKKFNGRVHGVDLMEKVSMEVSNKPITVACLGGGKNVAQKASNCLKEKYPGLKVAFAESEWDEIKGKKSSDILFVAFGSPKQEKWIHEHLPTLDAKVVIGVGGAFDFISGNVRRAPSFIRRIGLEWLFRLLIQPWRWKRQLSLIKFVFEVIKEKLGF